MAVGRMQSATFVVHHKDGGLHPPYSVAMVKQNVLSQFPSFIPPKRINPSGTCWNPFRPAFIATIFFPV